MSISSGSRQLDLLSTSPCQFEDDSIDYFGDLEGANVDELELSPRKESTLRRMMKLGSRQASDLSEASMPISSTPDAERYFRRKQAEFQALQGGPDLEITVSDYDLDERSQLKVLPVQEEIEILSLSEEPVLAVRNPMSSFETLYDKCGLEEGSFPQDCSRSSFHATYQVPERVSSFEQLYDEAACSSNESAVSRHQSSHRHSIPSSGDHLEQYQSSMAFSSLSNRKREGHLAKNQKHNP